MGELIGRFHPLIVHLPIGIIAVAFLMELASKREKYKHLQPAISFVLLIAVITTAFAWFTGWIMPKEGDFGATLVGQHFWFSTALLVSCTLVYWLSIHRDTAYDKFYKPLFYLTMALLLITGHFGGSLTHGEDHLTSPLTSASRLKVSDVNTLAAYPDIIQPILKQKCYSCHNEGKKKGGLIMTSPNFLLEGGESGPSIAIGDTENSLLIQRLHLPLEDEEHMPPKGKNQITDNELQLLEWWINEGSPFEELVGNINQSTEISSILKTYETNDSEPDPSGLPLITDEQKAKFLQEGISIIPESETSPFVHVDLSRNDQLSKRHFNQLAKIKAHVKSLDLSFSNMNDEFMAKISVFENLCNLKLQHTAISSQGLLHLEELAFLKTLNLYGTAVDTIAFTSLAEMPALSKLYLWQTPLTAAEVNNFTAQHPLISISHNIDISIFGDARLKPPIITAEKDIFSDSLMIDMTMNLNGVGLYYTLDGSEPDSTSTRYDTTFAIYKTAAIRAFSAKQGWLSSETVEEVFIKAGHLVEAISLDKQPNEKYRAKGAKSLIDFEKGTDSFTDGKWLGYEGENVIVTLDLGDVKNINSVVVGALENTASYIFFPKKIAIAGSSDGRSFTAVKELDIPIAEGQNPPALRSFLLSFDETKARFVQVKIFGVLKNPSWHAAPGANNWLFIDEILVN